MNAQRAISASGGQPSQVTRMDGFASSASSDGKFLYYVKITRMVPGGCPHYPPLRELRLMRNPLTHAPGHSASGGALPTRIVWLWTPFRSPPAFVYCLSGNASKMQIANKSNRSLVFNAKPRDRIFTPAAVRVVPQFESFGELFG